MSSSMRWQHLRILSLFLFFLSQAFPSLSDGKTKFKDLFQIFLDLSNAESIDLSQIPVAENDEQDIENITQKFQGKKNSEEIILQPLCKDILDLLIEKKKFNDTIKKFFVDLVLHTKLTLEQCSNDVNFLPVNFKNNCANGEIDIAILLESSKSEYLFKFPILIGELKTKIDEDTDYIQMLNYQLSVQRPYCVTAGRSHLLGFLMDFRNAYIFDFEVGYWTDPYPVPSDNIKINRVNFKFEQIDTTFVIQIFKFYYYLLETLTSKLLKLNLSEFSLLTYWKSPTIRFPIEPQLPDDDNRFSSYIIPFHKDNWMEIGKHLHKNDRAFVEFTSQLNDVKNDEFLLLKVYGALLSEGWTYPNQLSKFLKACQNLDSNSRLRALIVEQLYLGVYSIRNKSSVRFSLMRYIPGELCSSEDFPKWWKQNREKAKIAFFRDVYEPALEAIECGYYHWDICSENLICDKTNFKFYILDWESLIDIDLPEQLENFVSQNAKDLGFDTSVSTKVAISLCENLLVSCLYIWEGYEKQGGKWAEQIFKLFVKIIPIVVLDSDNVLFSESKLVYDNIMLQCIQLAKYDFVESFKKGNWFSYIPEFYVLTSSNEYSQFYFNVQENKDVLVSCKFTLPFAPHFTEPIARWFRNDEPVDQLNTSSRIEHILGDPRYTCTLHIPSIQLFGDMQSYTYHCELYRLITPHSLSPSPSRYPNSSTCQELLLDTSSSGYLRVLPVPHSPENSLCAKANVTESINQTNKQTMDSKSLSSSYASGGVPSGSTTSNQRL